MLARDSSLGSGNSILRSRRPDRRRAGSRTSTRLVAARTLMRSSEAKPSSWLRSSSIVRWTSRSPDFSLSNRLVPMASSSSMKMIEGAFSLASAKQSRTILAVTDEHLHELRARQFEEGCVGFGCAGSRQECFTRSWGSVHQSTYSHTHKY